MNAMPIERVRDTELAILTRQLIRDKCLRINRYHLLELVGKQNDAAGNWKLVEQAMEDNGLDLDKLYYANLGRDEMVMLLSKPEKWS